MKYFSLKPLMLKLIAVIILSFLIFFYANAQTKLKSGSKIEAEIFKGEQDVYTLKAKKGQYLDMLIQQSGVGMYRLLYTPQKTTALNILIRQPEKVVWKKWNMFLSSRANLN